MQSQNSIYYYLKQQEHSKVEHIILDQILAIKAHMVTKMVRLATSQVSTQLD